MCLRQAHLLASRADASSFASAHIPYDHGINKLEDASDDFEPNYRLIFAYTRHFHALYLGHIRHIHHSLHMVGRILLKLIADFYFQFKNNLS